MPRLEVQGYIPTPDGDKFIHVVSLQWFILINYLYAHLPTNLVADRNVADLMIDVRYVAFLVKNKCAALASYNKSGI